LSPYLVPDIVQKLEEAYPSLKGQITCGRDVYCRVGHTDLDIESPYWIVQVKDTRANSGLTKQIKISVAYEKEMGTNRPVIGYRPKIGGEGVEAAEEVGGLATGDLNKLIELCRP